jgi:hypothetical protein
MLACMAPGGPKDHDDPAGDTGLPVLRRCPRHLGMVVWRREGCVLLHPPDDAAPSPRLPLEDVDWERPDASEWRLCRVCQRERERAARSGPPAE